MPMKPHFNHRFSLLISPYSHHWLPLHKKPPTSPLQHSPSFSNSTCVDIDFDTDFVQVTNEEEQDGTGEDEEGYVGELELSEYVHELCIESLMQDSRSMFITPRMLLMNPVGAGAKASRQPRLDTIPLQDTLYKRVQHGDPALLYDDGSSRATRERSQEQGPPGIQPPCSLTLQQRPLPLNNQPTLRLARSCDCQTPLPICTTIAPTITLPISPPSSLSSPKTMLPSTTKGSSATSPNMPEPEQEPSSGSRPPPKMQRFTRPEDLADLEDMGVREPNLMVTNAVLATSTGASSRNTTRSRSNSGSANRPSGPHHTTDQERARRYIEAHTTFLNSADPESSGYIPSQIASSLFARPHAYDGHRMADDLGSPLLSSSSHSIASRTPIHYPSSLVGDDEGYTAPGSPHSFLSSPSLGYYSHPSRPSSRTGFWFDQGASSLNLIMPSSDLFVKSREPTPEGDKLGFVKWMVAGKNRVWHSRLIQDMFKWDGVIANDFEDDFLQGHRQTTSSEDTTSVGTSGSRHPPGSGHLSDQQDETLPDKRQERHHGGTETIMERYGSSMVLPAWARPGLEDQELQQQVLVKNICFVDTPGYGSFKNQNRVMDLVVSYLGLQFQTTNEFFSKSAVSDDSLGRFLANNSTGAHSHVDLCLYVIEGQLTDQDVVFMQRLQPWVNLIPVLIPMSTTTHGVGSDPAMPHTNAIDVASARLELIRQLRENNIEIYGIEDDEARITLHAGASAEDDLSPPPLSLDGHPLQSEFTCPPFVFYVPEVSTSAFSDEISVTEHGNTDGRKEGSMSSATRTSGPRLDPFRHEPLPDLSALRRWVFVDNLAVLRHLTTLKFLRWRRHLQSMTPSPMYSSQESGSVRQRSYPYGDAPYPSASGHLAASHRTPLPTTSSPILSMTGPTPSHQQTSPTEAASHFIAQDQRRIAEKATRLLGSHRQVFERIMLERQETWRLALESMEREERIDFLVRELKRWATEGYRGQDGGRPPREYGSSIGTRGHVVSLGMEAGLSMNTEPSLRDALGQPRSMPPHSNRGQTPHGGSRPRPTLSKRSTISKSQSSSAPPRRQTWDTQKDDTVDKLDRDESLGPSLWMGHFIGAIGRGIVQVVVMVGMGGFATWIYTQYLENTPMWIG